MAERIDAIQAKQKQDQLAQKIHSKKLSQHELEAVGERLYKVRNAKTILSTSSNGRAGCGTIAIDAETSIE